MVLGLLVFLYPLLEPLLLLSQRLRLLLVVDDLFEQEVPVLFLTLELDVEVLVAGLQLLVLIVDLLGHIGHCF